MLDLPSPMYHRILGLDHPTLCVCFTRSIFQASLLAHLWAYAYSLVGFIPFFDVERVGQDKLFVVLGCSGALLYLPGGLVLGGL
jgi:hypothetical protein